MPGNIVNIKKEEKPAPTNSTVVKTEIKHVVK